MKQPRVIETLVEKHCEYCGADTWHRYDGNIILDGGVPYGLYICKKCKSRQKGVPMIEWNPECDCDDRPILCETCFREI